MAGRRAESSAAIRRDIIRNDPTALTAGQARHQDLVGRFADLGREEVSAANMDLPLSTTPATAEPATGGPSAQPKFDFTAPRRVGALPNFNQAKRDAASMKFKARIDLAKGGDEKTTREVLDQWQAQADKAATADYTNPSTRRHIEHMALYYDLYCEEQGVDSALVWTTEVVYRHAGGMLTSKVDTTQGHHGEHVKAGTMEVWHLAFLTCVVRYTHDAGTQARTGVKLLSTGGLYEILANVCQGLINKYHLDTTRTTVHYWGIAEARLLLAESLANSSSSGSSRLVHNQTNALLVIALYLGWRPSTPLVPYLEWLALKRVFVWENVKATRPNGRIGTPDIELDLGTWKGKSEGAQGKVVKFYLKAVTKVHNVDICPASWFGSHGVLQGAFGKKMTLEEYHLTGTATNVPIDPAFLERPVFCAVAAGGYGLDINKPAMVHYGYEATARIAKNAGLPQCGVFGAFRHDVADAMEKRRGLDVTGLLLAHEDNSKNRTAVKHYIRGVGGEDLVGLRLGEYDDDLSTYTKARLQLNAHECAAAVTLIGRRELEIHNAKLRRVYDAADIGEEPTLTTNIRTQYGTISVGTKLQAKDREVVQDLIRPVLDQIDAEYQTLLQVVKQHSAFPDKIDHSKNKLQFPTLLKKAGCSENADALASVSRLEDLFRNKMTRKRAETKKVKKAVDKLGRTDFHDNASKADSGPTRAIANASIAQDRPLIDNAMQYISTGEGAAAGYVGTSNSLNRLAQLSYEHAHATQDTQTQEADALFELRKHLPPDVSRLVRNLTIDPDPDMEEKYAAAEKRMHDLPIAEVWNLQEVQVVDDTKEEEEFEGLDVVKLRYAIQAYAYGPVRADLEIVKKYRRDKLWRCDQPKCSTANTIWSTVARHLVTAHSPWATLLASLKVPGIRKTDKIHWHCTTCDPEFLYLYSEDLELHLVTDCKDSERQRQLLISYEDKCSGFAHKSMVRNAYDARLLLSGKRPAGSALQKHNRKPKQDIKGKGKASAEDAIDVDLSGQSSTASDTSNSPVGSDSDEPAGPSGKRKATESTPPATPNSPVSLPLDLIQIVENLNASDFQALAERLGVENTFQDDPNPIHSLLAVAHNELQSVTSGTTQPLPDTVLDDVEFGARIDAILRDEQ